MLARGEKKREIANSASLLLAVTCEYQETKRPRFLHQVQSKKIGESLENYAKEEQQSLGKKRKNRVRGSTFLFSGESWLSGLLAIELIWLERGVPIVDGREEEVMD